MTPEQLAALGVLLALSLAWGLAVAYVWGRYGARWAAGALALLGACVWAGVVAAAGGPG